MENTINAPETLIFKDAKDINAPIPAMLLGNLWHQDEVAVLFGNQQSGKSMLAVQVAEAISSGQPLQGFKMDGKPQKVLYFDFDKSGYHFNQLYAGYRFSPNFRRLVVNKKNLDFKHLAEQFFFSVEELMCEEGAGVLIFDSLPAIKCFVKDSYFLKGIQRLKEYSDVSILLVGETKKEIKGKPLRLNHLDAHKQLLGFADSVFAMGHTSGDADERYFIHLKSAERRIHNKDNVVMGRLMVPPHAPFGSAHGDTAAVTPSEAEGRARALADGPVTGVTPVTPFLPGFVFTGYNTEIYVISPPEGLDLDILTLKQQQPELSLGEIAKELKTNKMRVKRVLEKFENSPSPQPINTAEPLHSAPLHVERGNIEISDHSSEPGVREKPENLPDEPYLSESSFSSPGLQPGGRDNKTILRTDSLCQGNDGLPHDETHESSTTNPFRGDVKPSEHPSDSGVKSKSEILISKSENLRSPQPMNMAEPLHSVPLHMERGNIEISDHSSEPGVREKLENLSNEPGLVPPTDSLFQGNDGPPHTETPEFSTTSPFRGDVEPSKHPSDSGVKTQKPLTFSQRVKKQIAQKNIERRKGR